MKILAIGDLHGHDYWQDVHPKHYDKIIFLGDYCDSFEVGDQDIIDNLNNVLQFKLENPDKVVLLIGNHDDHYTNAFGRGSGYRESYALHMKEFFKKNAKFFNIAHQEGNYLFSHAGIRKDWYDKHISPTLVKYDLLGTDRTISKNLDDIYFTTSDNWRFCTVGPVRGGDRYDLPGPLWCDRTELIKDPIHNWNQVVGHSRVKEITHVDVKSANAHLVFCDTLENTKGQNFYELTL